MPAMPAGVVAVSMSWGGGEFSGENSYDSYFTTPSGHSGVTFFARRATAAHRPAIRRTRPTCVRRRHDA